jgi:hypothetical protein
MDKRKLELYTDYLIGNYGYATATGLSAMVDGAVGPDRITRFLSERQYTSVDLWLTVKSAVRQMEQEDGVPIADDTIAEKLWTDENEVVCWHYDHTKGRLVKGINLLNMLYHSRDVSLPVAFEVIRKPLLFCDLDTRQLKRASLMTKNELMRDMICACLANQLKFRYVLMDSWFAARENFEFIVKKGKHFIAALKDNRLVALSEQDRQHKRFERIDRVSLPEKEAVHGWLKGYGKEVLLVRQVFTNEDGSTAILHLVCSDLTLDDEQVTVLYQKRWNVEVFHKSLKSNAGLAKSPTFSSGQSVAHRPRTENGRTKSYRRVRNYLTATDKAH